MGSAPHPRIGTPAEAGVHVRAWLRRSTDSSLRRNDDYANLNTYSHLSIRVNTKLTKPPSAFGRSCHTGLPAFPS